MSRIHCSVVSAFVLGNVSTFALVQDTPALGHYGHDLSSQKSSANNDSVQHDEKKNEIIR